MKNVPVTAQLLAPVSIKRDRQSERSESVRSVAGTLIRGALASIYLQHHGQVDDIFRRLFLNEASCRFGSLDPGPQIFPLTAASCKREGVQHALVDQLWFRTAQHHMAGGVPEDAETAWRQCEKCKTDLKSHEGFWQNEDSRLYEKGSDQYHVAAHVGIDRRTNTAAESMFYTLEGLMPCGNETDLYGWLMADDDALDALNQLLQEEDHRISVGHARTRGYGDLRLRLGDPTDVEAPPWCMQRWNQWSRDLIGFLGSPPLSVPNLAPESFYFALSFPTGAVLVDRFLRYTLDPSDMIPWLPAMPSAAAAFPMQDRPSRQLASGGAVHWISGVTRHKRLRGWNAAHGLPRQDEWAIARGAVYVYRFDGTSQEREAILQQLTSLLEDGVGLRKNEGFGVVEVSDEFHRRFRNQEAQTMTVLNNKLIHEANRYIDERHETFTALGKQLYEQFGSDKGKISTQVRNLQQVACSATRFVDIEDFVKNQMGKDNRNAKSWRALGEDLLGQLSCLRKDSQELDDDPGNQMALRLRFARGWVRAVVGEYLYQVALKQMGGSHERR